MQPRTPPPLDSDTFLRVVLGALGIGAFPLLALGYQAHVLGPAAYSTLAIAAFVVLGVAILWPAPRPAPRPARTPHRRSPAQGEHHA